MGSSILSSWNTHSLSKAFKTGQITEDDKFLIEKYVAWSARGDRSIGRLNKITFHLVGSRRFIGVFRTNTIDDITVGINHLKNDEILTIPSEHKPAHPYKQNTKRDFVSIIKKFYIWLVRNGYSVISKDDVGELQVPNGDTMTKTAADIFTEEEIHAMISACESLMERAMIITLYEGGFRIKELATLTWGQVFLTEQNAVINVNMKTSIPRRVPAFSAKSYLAAWKSDFPYPIETDSLVFLNAQRRPFNHATITKRIRTIAQRAGITKKIKAHDFRHTRVSHLKQKGISEYLIKKVTWGNQNTKMLATYCHLCDADVDKELSDMYGITNVNPSKFNIMDPRQCAHCGNVNSPTSNYCGICGLPLTAEVALTTEQLAIEIQNTPLYKQLMEDVKKNLLNNVKVVV